MSKSVFIDAAHRIGLRLTESAVWSGNRCSWQKAPRGHLYGGTAGMALFLADLFAATGDDSMRDCAAGALRHALHLAEETPGSSFGLYVGDIGLAHVASRIAAPLEAPDLLERAIGCLRPLIAQPDLCAQSDVIAGKAGAILGLLTLSKSARVPGAIDAAVELGHLLVASARRRPVGWSWHPGAPTQRDLVGLSHGAAGCGLAFLELYAATADRIFLHASDQAFAYERHSYDRSPGGWPDYRDLRIPASASDGERIADVERIVAERGSFPPREATYPMSWCHGAAGIGLARGRAYQLTGNAEHLAAARVAVERMKQSLATRLNDCSLCHGALGHLEALAMTGDMIGETLDPGFVARQAENALERLKSERIGDPTLMQGEAGIGLCFLRLAVPEIPSILLLTPEAPVPETRDTADASGRVHMLRREHTKMFFRETVEYLGRHDLLLLDVPAAHEALESLVRSPQFVSSERLADVFAVEKTILELEMNANQGTDELIRFASPRWEALDRDRTKLMLSPIARVLESRHPWTPEKPTGFWLARWTYEGVRFRAIRPLAYAILETARQQNTVTGIVDTLVDEHFGIAGDADVGRFRHLAIGQIETLYRASLIAPAALAEGLRITTI